MFKVILCFLFLSLGGSLWAASPTNVFSSGTVISATAMNQNFNQVPIKVLHIKTTSSIGVPMSPETNLTNAIINNMFISSTYFSYSSGSSTYTVLLGGLYRLTFFTNSSGDVMLKLKKNGSTDVSSGLVNLTTSDTFQLYATSTTGGTLNSGAVFYFEKLD